MEEIVMKIGGVIMCLFFVCGFVISNAWLWGCAFGMVVTAIGLYYDM